MVVLIVLADGGDSARSRAGGTWLRTLGSLPHLAGPTKDPVQAVRGGRGELEGGAGLAASGTCFINTT